MAEIGLDTIKRQITKRINKSNVKLAYIQVLYSFL